MAKVHGRHTYISANGTDISQYCNSSTFNRSADVHKTTGYTMDSHTYDGGITDGTFEAGGVYDGTTTPTAAPPKLFADNEGTLFDIVRRVEGTGASKPQTAFDAVLTEYVETSPLADMVAWSAKFQISGVVDHTPQAP